MGHADRQAARAASIEPTEAAGWRFKDILAFPEIRERWDKVRKFFFLRESTYDMTNRCNIRCDGCYYYEGQKQFSHDNMDLEAWRRLMREEKARGITYVVLAGAEPALVPDLLAACYEEMPLGCIASNGVRRIPSDVGYKVHVSVWGSDETSRRVRGAKDMLRRQADNYAGDPRAVFVYTYTRENIPETDEVVAYLAERGCKVTFNMFSAPVGYQGPLRHDAGSLLAARRSMAALLTRHPGTVLFSTYNAMAHTQPEGLHAVFRCSYPRMNPSTDIGLGRSFRQYRSDLTWDRDAACCVPDTDCLDCRHYASGSAVVPARMYRHATSPLTFMAWLDYVDTYLAVWVMGYPKGENLTDDFVAPPASSAEAGR